MFRSTPIIREQSTAHSTHTNKDLIRHAVTQPRNP